LEISQDLRIAIQLARAMVGLETGAEYWAVEIHPGLSHSGIIERFARPI
jgi:hypothetical protein